MLCFVARKAGNLLEEKIGSFWLAAAAAAAIWSTIRLAGKGLETFSLFFSEYMRLVQLRKFKEKQGRKIG